MKKISIDLSNFVIEKQVGEFSNRRNLNPQGHGFTAPSLLIFLASIVVWFYVGYEVGALK